MINTTLTQIKYGIIHWYKWRVLTKMTQNTLQFLMVEDDADLAVLYTIILSRNGYQVTTASDAETALKQLAIAPVDVMLTDWNLPVMKGDELITIAKAEYPNIKTILFSNHVHIDQAGIACGADAWFRKMDGRNALLELISDIVKSPATTE